MIVVVDFGVGNLQSVVRALERAGGSRVMVSSAVEAVAAAEKLVLPGVGSLAGGMDSLARDHLVDVLTRQVMQEHTPVLGICLGLQMVMGWSEEGDSAGLGWIEGHTRRLRSATPDPHLKVPHMGWNSLRVQRPCPLLRDIPDDACFYFAHSYCVESDDASVVAATTQYGTRFVSVLHKDNIFGTQFHPEKSQANGLHVLKNFLAYT